jgi:hypothetical protein
MNTASRMESTGISNKIQMSQETSELLIIARKHHWCIPREDKVCAKGKGLLSTFWLQATSGRDGKPNLTSDMFLGTDTNSSVSSFDHLRDNAESNEKKNRIADWTVEVLACLLKEIGSRRKATNFRSDSRWRLYSEPVESATKKNAPVKKNTSVIDEVEEIIMLPEFNAQVARREQMLDASDVLLSQEVFDELRDYVLTIAALYNDNRKWCME